MHSEIVVTSPLDASLERNSVEERKIKNGGFSSGVVNLFTKNQEVQIHSCVFLVLKKPRRD